MNTSFFTRALSVGLALFAMLFGSGNIVYPLMLGRSVGDQAWWGMAGFFVAAVCMPLIGVLSCILFEGNYTAFLNRVGKVPGAVVAFLCLALIGPFGVAPRCVTLAYAPVKWYMPTFPLWIFTVLAGALIFACTVRPTFVLQLLGRVLGPLKFGLVGLIIVKGLFKTGAPLELGMSASSSFMAGVQSGYGTMDLMAAIFFSSLIVAGLRQSAPAGETTKGLLKVAVAAGVVGAMLLGVVYAGFVLIASLHGAAVMDVPKAELFSALACLILGREAGLFANITVAVTCMTTAIALTTIFAQYLQSLMQGRISYVQSLFVTLAITVGLSNLGFETILIMLDQAVTLIYPALIVLAIVNLAYKLWGFRFVQIPFFATVVATAVMTLW